MPDEIFRQLRQELNGDLRENEILAPYTTFKIGGPARYFYVAKDPDDFMKAIELANKFNISYLILGGGSNILVSEKGFSGVVIRKQNGVPSRDFKIEGDKIITDAQVKLGVLVQKTGEAGLTGLEWAAGIPGTVGGAVRGNAGAYGGEMSQNVTKITALCGKKCNQKKSFDNKDMNFSYRHSMFKKNKKCAILSIELQLKKGDKKLIEQRIKKIVGARNRNSTPQYPSAGCIFKNPIVENNKILEDFKKETGDKLTYNKIPAGYLIDKLGLKGKKIGGAMISDKNANFILNIGDATAEHVIMLISFIKH